MIALRFASSGVDSGKRGPLLLRLAMVSHPLGIRAPRGPAQVLLELRGIEVLELLGCLDPSPIWGSAALASCSPAAAPISSTLSSNLASLPLGSSTGHSPVFLPLALVPACCWACCSPAFSFLASSSASCCCLMALSSRSASARARADLGTPFAPPLLMSCIWIDLSNKPSLPRDLRERGQVEF